MSNALTVLADSSQPAFLQRLRGQLAGDDSARHQQPIARNKRAKQDDEDDAPTYVLEDTNQSLTKEEYEALVSGKDDSKAEDSTTGNGQQTETAEQDSKPKRKIPEVGTNFKKRKVAKVIGDEEPSGSKASAKTSEISTKEPGKRPKKKGKPVKLSFGDDGEGE